MVDFATVVAGEEILEEHINQFAAWLNGNDSEWYATASIVANDASAYALQTKNLASPGFSFRALDTTGLIALLSSTDSGTTMYIANGSASAPSIALLNSTTSGLYRYGSLQLGVTIGGAAQNVFASGVTYFPAGASVNAPGIAFLLEGGLGMRRVSAANGSLTSSGTDRILWNSSGVAFNGATPATAPDYTVANGSTDRSLDVTGDTTAQVAAVLGTLISDLIAIGLLQ